ncbi:MAG TPA: amino acid adenylation domain-containing protein, partial [Pyrinomonadaceae bacterium]|nr:amino acid adenylation domain-containing protein [Pyrinomonadaceae bacterium]
MHSLIRFSSVIIGAGTLPLACAEILLTRGHEISRIISSDPHVMRWAIERGIPHFRSVAHVYNILVQQPFDYLFSIANEQILTEDVLRLPRRLAINYHDGPLPRYAGSNAASWALMNGETMHGITWHSMIGVVDAGDILKQQSVPIAHYDTAVSLNTKCYEAAINSFAQLIAELESGHATAKKQKLGNRTFYPKCKRAPAAGVISWRRKASDIDCLVRALSFGVHPNPLSSPKIAIANEFLLVPELQILDSLSTSPAGTITEISADSLTVATRDRLVALHKVTSLHGETIPISDLATRWNLRRGQRLPELDSASAKRLELTYASSCRHESFWVDRLASLKPASLPYGINQVSSREAPRLAKMVIKIPHYVFSSLQSQWPELCSGDVLLAAYAAFIGRLGGINSFDIGYSDSALQFDAWGFEKLFAVYLPLRIDIDLSQPLAAVIGTVKNQVASLRAKGPYSHDIVARYPELSSIRNSGGSFQLPVAAEKVKELKDDQHLTPNCEILFSTLENASKCCFTFDQNKLPENYLSSLRSYFTTFLRGVAANPEQPVSSLPLLTERERNQILIEWNDVEADGLQDKCLHQLFEEQVAMNPHAEALVFGERRLTYLQLNNRANQLANLLLRMGANPEVPIGICVERSPEMVVALFAVLKAGAAYVPLDPTYPKERLVFMVKDSQAPILLTQQRFSSIFEKHSIRVLYLDTDSDAIGKESECNPRSESTADNLAYIIYTSGSMGDPKGVLISHHALVNHSLAVIKHYQLNPSDRVLQFASISFDVAAEELFATLLSGAAVVLPDERAAPSVADFVALLAKDGLTVINLPSCYWHELVHELELSRKALPSTLRLVVTGSEKVLPGRLAAWQKMFGNSIRWLNAYGPTEATVTATLFEPSGEPTSWSSGAVPIGRPLINRQTYILDSYLNPVPIGVPGELHIGGASLARGYLNSPALTAEKFIANPFRQESGARLYKTGDRARYLPDGNIEFLGRMDRQVKVRGFRIELGEVENVLAQHPSVRACTVIAQETEGETKLIAYVAPVGKKLHSVNSMQKLVSEVRRLLQEKLPQYMVPSAVIVVDDMPLTANGKVNRQALPSPDLSISELESTHAPIEDQVLLNLKRIWEKVLGIRPIGFDDSFFDLGGHSLQGVRMFAHVEKTFGKNIPLATLLQADTINKLAAVIRRKNWSPVESSLVAIQPHGERPPFFCIHALGGRVLLYHDLARFLGEDQPFYGLQARHLVGPELGDFTVEEMAEFYIKEMQTIQPEGPYFIGGLSFGGVTAFEMAQQLYAKGQSVALLAVFDAETPDYEALKSAVPGGRLQHHWDRLKMLNLRERVEYVRSKLGAGYQRLAIGFSMTNKIRSKSDSLPSVDSVIEKRIRDAFKRYVPQIYPGQMTLFRAADRAQSEPVASMLGWRDLAAGGVKVFEVPGDHRSIILEPNVQVLAGILKSCIERAQLKVDQANYSVVEPVVQTPISSSVSVQTCNLVGYEDVVETSEGQKASEWILPSGEIVLGEAEVHVWRASLNLKPASVHALLQTLSADEIARASSFYFEQDRTRFIAARGLLRKILGHYLRTEAASLTFSYN